MRTTRNQSGFSLIELMVSLVAGMIVVGAVLAFALSSIRSNSEYVRSTRLTQELRTVLDTAAEDLRRAGYDQDAMNYVARPPTFTNASPFSKIFINAANNCVIYAYDRADPDDADNGTLNFENGEVRGLRLASRTVNGRQVGVVEMAESTSTAQPICTGSAPDYSTTPATCSANGWCPISDPRVINVTQFQVNNDRPATGGVAGLIPASGSAVLPMQLRKMQVSLTGALIAEPTVIRTMATDIRVRADCVRSAAATNCIAVPDGT
jgi:Tfp pilus assembly protein PilW